MNNFVIKPLTREFLVEHTDEFIDIAADIPGEAWIQENYLYELPGKWDFSLVMLDPEVKRVIGFIIASDKISGIHIHKYAVHPEFRSQKAGKKLLHYFEKNIKHKSKHRTIGLYVDVNNEKAINFYLKSGFQFVERIETMNYYQKVIKLVVSIHQPNFFPWLGFFHKMASCDHFIILDHVLNNPGDTIYPRRVKIICNSLPFWLTIPLVKNPERTFIPIREMEISETSHFAEKQLKTIEMSYKRTPFFDRYFYLFKQFYNNPSRLIAQRNFESIIEIKKCLGLETTLSLSSSYPVTGNSNQMLIELIKAVNGDVYLHGSFAVSDKGYQDNELFLENDIELSPQKFSHPVYKQYNNKNEFIQGASILDAFMNSGADYTASSLFKEN